MPFFKKVDPKQKVLISTGQYVQFEAVEHRLGIYPPEGKGMSEALANEFRLCIRQERGGITEITQQEYSSLLEQKKKNGPLRPLWREELSSQTFPKLAAVPSQKRSSPPVAGVKPAPPPVGIESSERPTASKVD